MKQKPSLIFFGTPCILTKSQQNISMMDQHRLCGGLVKVAFIGKNEAKYFMSMMDQRKSYSGEIDVKYFMSMMDHISCS